MNNREPRSARFEVTWCDSSYHNDYDVALDRKGRPASTDTDDYIVLELRQEDVARLHRELSLFMQIDEALDKQGRADVKGLWTVLLHGIAHPQRGDRADGTTTYPPSLLSDEVLAETPKVERWK